MIFSWQQGRDCRPCRHGDSRPGVALITAVSKNNKRELTRPELLAAGRCKLVLHGCETGGTGSDEALDARRHLASANGRFQPEWRRASAVQDCVYRWPSKLAAAAQHAFAASLLELLLANEDRWDGQAPVCHDAVADAHCPFPVLDSRLGPS